MLKINEILDRYRILYPQNEYISDLYRSYFEKDFFSIYKIINRGSTDDLKHRAKNLKKFVLEDNIWSLWDFLFESTDTQFTHALKSLYVKNIEYSVDCFSRGQLQSKLWLIDELKKTNQTLGTVFLCAGWYATLAVMIFENNFRVEKIRSFDIDSFCPAIAETFNKPWVIDNWKFKSSIANIHDIDFDMFTYSVSRSNGTQCELTDAPDTIINTSCEHIVNFDNWYSRIPKGKLVVLQSNNYKAISDHVNCVNNLSEFEKQTPMTDLLFEGELDLSTYTRFMRIGIR